VKYMKGRKQIFIKLIFSTGLILLSSLVCAQDRLPKKPDVHFVPTPPEIVEVMLRLADVNKNDVVYDLGCGDGRIVIAAAKKAGAKGYGVDIDPEMVKKSQENVEKEGVRHLVLIEERDIFEIDLRGATVIMLYLLPELNRRLIPQLDRLKPGVRIVSHEFDMEGIIPDVEATVYRYAENESKVYLWTTPLRKRTTTKKP